MRLSYPRLAGYALGAFGTGVFSTVPTVLLLFFCTEILGMPPALAGLVVFLPKLWALVWDPIVGIWSDRTSSRLGRRRPFLLAGGILVSALFLALFAWPYPAGEAAFPWVAAIYFILASAYSLFAVPFIAVPAEISVQPAERERVTAWRIGFGMIGTLIGAGIAPMLVHAFGGGRAGYAAMALVVAAICSAGMFSAFLTTPSTTGVPASSPAPLRRSLQVLLADRAFRRLTAAYILQLTGMGVISAITPYWIVQVAGRGEDGVGAALGLMLIVTVLYTPLWAWAIRRFGAGNAIAAAAFLCGAGTLGFLLVPAGSMAGGLLLYALIGLPFAGIQVGPFALAAHLTHAAAEASGNRDEGLFTGAWTASEKLGLALGPGVVGLGLALVGFQSGSPVQSPEAIKGITWLLAILPTLFLWASLLLLRPNCQFKEALA